MGGGGNTTNNNNCGGARNFSCGGPPPKHVLSSAPSSVVSHLVQDAAGVSSVEQIANHDLETHLKTLTSSLRATCETEFRSQFGYNYSAEGESLPEAGPDSGRETHDDMVICEVTDTEAVGKYVQQLVDEMVHASAETKQEVVADLGGFVVSLLSASKDRFTLSKYQKSFPDGGQTNKSVQVEAVMNHRIVTFPKEDGGSRAQFIMHFCGAIY